MRRDPTINQVNGQIAKNQTLQFYRSLGLWSDDWRNRSFTFSIPAYRKPVLLTPIGNFIYAAAMRQFSLISGHCGYNYGRDNKHLYFEIAGITGHVLQFRVWARYDVEGVYLSYETNFKPMAEGNFTRITIRSNERWRAFGLEAYFRRHVLRKYLYESGLFRNIQVWKNCDKATALAVYRNDVLKKAKEPIDMEKAWRRYFKRKLNIQIDDSERLNMEVPAKKFERQPTRKRLFKMPSTLELLDRYMSEYDTDDNIEGFMNEFYDDYPSNAIFI